jgi:hypothetical protein
MDGSRVHHVEQSGSQTPSVSAQHRFGHSRQQVADQKRSSRVWQRQTSRKARPVVNMRFHVSTVNGTIAARLPNIPRQDTRRTTTTFYACPRSRRQQKQNSRCLIRQRGAGRKAPRCMADISVLLPSRVLLHDGGASEVSSRSTLTLLQHGTSIPAGRPYRDIVAVDSDRYIKTLRWHEFDCIHPPGR